MHPLTRERGGPASLPALVGRKGPEAPQAQCFPSYPPTAAVGVGVLLLIPRTPPSQSHSAAAAPVTPFILMLGHLLPTTLPGELSGRPRGRSIFVRPVGSLASSS